MLKFEVKKRQALKSMLEKPLGAQVGSPQWAHPTLRDFCLCLLLLSSSLVLSHLAFGLLLPPDLLGVLQLEQP